MAGLVFILLVLVLCGVLAASDRNCTAGSAAGLPVQMTIIPDHANPRLTTNLTLRCALGAGSSASRLTKIFRMHIAKKSATGWRVGAERRDNEREARGWVHGSVRSQIRGAVRDAFLEVTLTEPVGEIFDVYRCDVTGFDDRFNVVTETSAELNIIETGFGGALLLAVLEKHRESAKETREGLRQTREEAKETLEELKETRENYDRLKREIFEVFGKMEEEYRALKTELANLRERDVELESLVAWPAGYYGLLQPKTGCPVDLAFFGGSHGFHKMHTESSSNSESDAHSSALSSLTKFVADSQNFMTLTFCEVTREFNPEPWPQGRFCVHKLIHSSCPAGFSEGKVVMDLEDSSHETEGRSTVTGGAQHFNFCCQSSGDPGVAIALPTRKPFLLYRRGGKCQKVENMKVSLESFEIDTEDTNNADAICEENCPDIDKVGSTMKFHLCHYTQA